MKTANLMEAMAYDKTGWSLIEESSDGSTIYMGKPLTPDAQPADPLWAIKKITRRTDINGNRVTEIRHAIGNRHVWSEKESLIYLY